MDKNKLVKELEIQADQGLSNFLKARKSIQELSSLEEKSSPEFQDLKELEAYFVDCTQPGTLKTKSGLLFKFAPEDVHIPAAMPGESEPGIEHQDGLYLTQPHGLYIWDGRKKGIVKSKKFTAHVDEPLYLLSGKLCYGVIKLSEPKKIDLDEFKKLESKHHISEAERKKWWPNAKELFYYPVTLDRKWKPARKWKVQKGPQVFVKDVKFKEELKESVREEKEDETRTEAVKREMKEFGDWYLVKQPKGKDFKYVAQVHIRGDSAHIDLRFEANDHLAGITLDTPSDFPKGKKQAALAKTKYNKFLYPVSPTKGKDYQILTELKLVQPKVWLTVKGKIPAGGIGATKHEPAEFVIVSTGTMRYGTQKTDFHEWLLKPDGKHEWDKHIKGRWVHAWIPRPQHYKKAGEGKYMWGLFHALKDDPYISYHDFDKEEAKAKKENVDMVWQNFNGEEFKVVAGKGNLSKDLKKNA